jgi:hypothetical protein
MDIYCGQLGMVTELPYCLSVNQGMPCGRTIGCWQERTDIVKILKAAFTDEQLTGCFGGPPKSRMERIMESLERVKGTVSASETGPGKALAGRPTVPAQALAGPGEANT